MKIFRSSSDYLSWKKTLPTSQSIGFVPTMGALHAGHLSLVSSSMKNAAITVVSIFVNPKQFSEQEDFDTYPRNLESDLNKLRQHDVDAVFVPSANDIYKGDMSKIKFDHPFSKMLEGASRPHFFPGVIDVVSRLFNIVQPNFAHFGRKDAQQLILIEKMVETEGCSIKIIPGKTIRESSGLAMSSRNEYLTIEQTKDVKIIWESLQLAKKMLDDGVVDPVIIRKSISSTLLRVDTLKIDYVSIVDIKNLIEINQPIRGDLLISVAVFVGGVRLIDNVFYNY